MRHDAVTIRNWKNDLLPYLPQAVCGLLDNVSDKAPIEEIRIRAERPLQLCFSGYERLLHLADGRPVITTGECQALLQRFCEQSLYAWETELGNGFLTLPGGYRIGLCGAMTVSDIGSRRLSEVCAFNIRIARQVIGAADPILPYITSRDGRLQNTLIISAPGCGKTTMLRDIARSSSVGRPGLNACRVSVVDTRYELSGTYQGVPQMDLGPRTDVLPGISRADGMRLMVTNMSPDLLITDELSTKDDVLAAMDAIGCGVTVIASAHAGSANQLLLRETLKTALSEGLFQRIVLLSRRNGAGTVEQVLNWNREPVALMEEVCCARLLS